MENSIHQESTVFAPFVGEKCSSGKSLMQRKHLAGTIPVTLIFSEINFPAPSWYLNGAKIPQSISTCLVFSLGFRTYGVVLIFGQFVPRIIPAFPTSFGPSGVSFAKNFRSMGLAGRRWNPSGKRGLLWLHMSANI
jgi:hypothetical protein